MSNVVIRVERLGKKYIIGHQVRRERYATLRETVARGALGFLRKAGDMLHGRPIVEGDQQEEVWALRDVSFEIERGDVVGIIGRNGAGKSTLLKILSRITEPTTGRVQINGRVASLLEVGTGFHSELSGRENIFLNGAILGMTRQEIRRRFDEIVAFAEVERFLDTPVKRYSSGMYVRLAFAVAAHLEPEILVVDEVLAVGDSEFQRKCLGKMNDVAQREGRTVLFVSHNMAAIKSLTARGILLDAGRVVFNGASESAVESYAELWNRPNTPARAAGWGRGQHTAISAVRLLDASSKSTLHYAPGKPLHVEIVFETDGSAGLSLELLLRDATQSNLAMASLYQFHGQFLPIEAGVYACALELDPIWLASGQYSFDVTTSRINSNWDHYVESAVIFEVPFSNPLGQPLDFKQSYGYGSLALLCKVPARYSLVESRMSDLSIRSAR